MGEGLCFLSAKILRKPFIFVLQNKKVFVGGLPADFPEEDLRKHFEQFGKVDEIEWPFDKQTKVSNIFVYYIILLIFPFQYVYGLGSSELCFRSFRRRGWG